MDLAFLASFWTLYHSIKAMLWQYAGAAIVRVVFKLMLDYPIMPQGYIYTSAVQLLEQGSALVRTWPDPPSHVMQAKPQLSSTTHFQLTLAMTAASNPMQSMLAAPYVNYMAPAAQHVLTQPPNLITILAPQLEGQLLTAGLLHGVAMPMWYRVRPQAKMFQIKIGSKI
jgi:Cu/Ag efflux protein CusF